MCLGFIFIVESQAYTDITSSVTFSDGSSLLTGCVHRRNVRQEADVKDTVFGLRVNVRIFVKRLRE